MPTVENTTTIVLFLIAIGILGWGYYRNRNLGKFGVLSWLQAVVLMVPWLLSFGALSLGIYINLAGILLLLVLSTGLYIFLGSRLRQAAQDPEVSAQLAQKLAKYQTENATEGAETDAKPVLNPIEIPHVPEEDLKLFQGIFGIDTFFATQTIPYPQGVIFKGNMRGEAASVHAKLSEKLREKVGDRYRLFLVPDPEERPAVVILSNSSDPQPATLSQNILAVVLFVATIATSLEAVGAILGFDFYAHTDRIGEVLPMALGIWTVLIAHEIGHQILAKLRQVKVSLPFFLPAGQIASFGSITRFESLLPNRSVLFDVALAGPAAGGIVSLLMLVVGFLLSQPGVGFELPSQFFQGSILVGTLAKVILGQAVHQTVVSIHPLVVIGWLGLVINALNLMPAGQLDGGRIIQAIYGRKIAQRTTIATLIVLGIVALINPANPVIIYWLVLVGFLQRVLERPTLEDITEPDDARAALGLLALFLTIATLIPFSPNLAGRLGIGG
jgi:membrane-associated protease RseP (regulator of RpoE activity)